MIVNVPLASLRPVVFHLEFCPVCQCTSSSCALVLRESGYHDQWSVKLCTATLKGPMKTRNSAESSGVVDPRAKTRWQDLCRQCCHCRFKLWSNGIVNSINSVLGRKFCVYCCRGRCYNILLNKSSCFYDSVAEWLRRLTRMHRVIKLEHPASISFGSTGSNPVAVDIVLFLLS